ncbi:MAG: hypothetical protein KAU46_10765 [Candidatus Aminicenantes bacterium]|nr:hypothetical protein [Candidatus Aminicenantes bacterium]
MKKYILAGLLALALIRPFSLESKQLFVRMSFALMHEGHVEDSWHKTADYYNFSSVKGKRTSPGIESGRWLYLTGLFKSNAHSLGYHAGACVDFDLSLNLFLSVEALYRVVNFREFKARVVLPAGFASFAKEMENLAVDSTFLYERQILGEENVGDIDYRISNFSYSGFSFRAGLKFKF